MNKLKLDKEELDLLALFENEEYVSEITDERKTFLSEVATETFKKYKRINIRISNRDLTALQRRALEEGLPYQTLVASILHKYVSGSLLDIAANKLQHRAL